MMRKKSFVVPVRNLIVPNVQAIEIAMRATEKDIFSLMVQHAVLVTVQD